MLTTEGKVFWETASANVASSPLTVMDEPPLPPRTVDEEPRSIKE